MARLKVLVVGDPASIHANRFVCLLQEIGYDVRVFQSEHYYSQEEHLRNTVVYVSNFDLSGPWEAPAAANTLVAHSPREMTHDEWAGQAGRKLRQSMRLALRRVFGGTGYVRPEDLPPRALHMRKVLEQWRPDLLISLKMQNDGYTVAEALAGYHGPRPAWVHFTWGTDIEFFGKHPDYAPQHVPRIRKVLEAVPYVISDCRRDQRQVREFGFSGVALGACIAPGGFDLGYIDELRKEAGPERDTILVKGREGGLVGKALNVFHALERMAPSLKGRRIRVMMATEPVRAAAERLRTTHGLDCEVLPRLSYRDLLLCFGRSRLAIAASDVDGTPSFLIEALAMGAFPIHSDMESIREWIEHGVNGLLFPVDDIDALVACIRRGLEDDALLSSAEEHNRALTLERLDRNRVRAMVKDLIENRVLSQAEGRNAA